jgi:hypothetical protein
MAVIASLIAKLADIYLDIANLSSSQFLESILEKSSIETEV